MQIFLCAIIIRTLYWLKYDGLDVNVFWSVYVCMCVCALNFMSAWNTILMVMSYNNHGNYVKIMPLSYEILLPTFYIKWPSFFFFFLAIICHMLLLSVGMCVFFGMCKCFIYNYWENPKKNFLSFRRFDGFKKNIWIILFL